MAAAKAKKKRERKATRQETEARIREIMACMASGQYVSVLTAQAFAEDWKLEPHTVENMASEASRRLRAAVMGDEDLVATLKSTFQSIGAICLHDKDYKLALEAFRSLGALVGSSVSSPMGSFERPTIVIKEASNPQDKPEQPEAPKPDDEP